MVYLGNLLEDRIPGLQTSPARMMCPRTTRFNAATKTCASMRAVPCAAKGNVPKPNNDVSAGGSSGGEGGGMAKSE